MAYSKLSNCSVLHFWMIVHMYERLYISCETIHFFYVTFFLILERRKRITTELNSRDVGKLIGLAE